MTRVADINEARRCRRCKRKLVKREYSVPATMVTWDNGVQTTTTASNGAVIWACPVCDFRGTA